MNCHSVRNLLDLRAENLLSPRRARTVDAHLASCPKCRAEAAPPSAPGAAKASDALKARLLSAMKSPAPAARVPGRAQGLSLWPREAPAIALAAAALALVAGLIAVSGVPSQSSGSHLATTVEEP